MNGRKKYSTRQRDEILKFLMTVPGKHITVKDVKDYFEREGIRVGTTTIYRTLESLVDEGEVAKYELSGASGACFEYLDKNHYCHPSSCYHCKCEKCGRLIHIDCDEILKVEQHLAKHHGFAVNTKRTVFYGLCKECRTKVIEAR